MRIVGSTECPSHNPGVGSLRVDSKRPSFDNVKLVVFNRILYSSERKNIVKPLWG
jgi:hypothetical protein